MLSSQVQCTPTVGREISIGENWVKVGGLSVSYFLLLYVIYSHLRIKGKLTPKNQDGGKVGDTSESVSGGVSLEP